MDWLGSLRDSEQDSEGSELVNESVKDRLRSLVNDAEQKERSNAEESFELPFTLFRRPNTKSEVRKSYVQRIVNTYLTNKVVPENTSNMEPSKVKSVPSPPKRMHPSSTPFYMSNARVAIENSLFLSPINSLRRKPNDSITDQKEQESKVKNTKEVRQTNLKRTKIPAAGTKKMKQNNKSKNVTGNIIKNTSKLQNEKSLNLNRTASSIVTKKAQSMLNRTNKDGARGNRSSKKKDLHTFTTLNPHRRRTFLNVSEDDLYEHVFEFDEESWYSDVLPKPKISYWDDIPYLINSSPKQKVVILENILIKGPQTEFRVNDSVAPEYNKNNNAVSEKSSSKKKNKSNEICIVPTDESIKIKTRSADNKIKLSNKNVVSPLTDASPMKKKRVSTNLNNEFFKCMENLQPIEFDKSNSRTGKINSSIERTIIQGVSAPESHVQGDNIEMGTINPSISRVKTNHDLSVLRVTRSSNTITQEKKSDATEFERSIGRPKKAKPSNLISSLQDEPIQNSHIDATEFKRPRGRPKKAKPSNLISSLQDATEFKRPRGRPKKAKPSNLISSLQDEPIQNSHIDSIPKLSMEEPNNNEFIKPTRPPPKKKPATSAHVGQVTSLRSTRLRELAEKVNNSVSKTSPLALELPSKTRKRIPRNLKPVEPADGKSVQVESISTTESKSKLSDNDVPNTRTNSRRKNVGKKIKASLVTHDNASINMEQTEEEITSSTSKPSRNRGKPAFLNAFFNPGHQRYTERSEILHKKRSSTIVKKKKTTRKMTNHVRINFKTILEESQLQSERQSINLELENNIISDNICENSQADNVQLKDSGIRVDSQELDSTAPENEGTFATKHNSVFVAKENVHRHFIFDLPMESSENKPITTQSLPKDAEVKIRKTVIKPGFRMANVTLKKYNLNHTLKRTFQISFFKPSNFKRLTIFVESGTGTYQLQSHTAQLTKNRFVRAYDGNEYSITNDGVKDLSLIYVIYPSKRI